MTAADSGRHAILTANEGEDFRPGGCVLLGELGELPVEESVRGARKAHELVLDPGRAEGPVEIGDRLGRDRRIRAAEEAEDG